MKRPAILVLAFLARATAAAAQDGVDPMAASVAQSFTMIERDFIRLADAMPAERWTFAPKDGRFEGVRTFAEQVKHVACANFGFFKQVEREEPPAGCESGGPSPAKTKDELMQYLRESFAYAARVMKRLTPGNAMDVVTGPYLGPFRGQTTRLGISTVAVWHATDHYGQLVVYLRMNGIVPPASVPR